MAFHILCIDDDPRFLLGVKISLKKQYQVSTAATIEEGMQVLFNQSVDLVFLDLHLGDKDSISYISQIKRGFPKTDVVMLSGERNPNLIVQAIQEGAVDYLCKPCATEEILAVLEKNFKNRDVKDRYEALIQNYNLTDQQNNQFVGNSPSFTSVLETARRLKGFNTSVLIEGESGTGKELLARHLHTQEENPNRPFIAVNCAAIPENLLESELFGYEQGAYTGASRKKVGRFELANGGDIFLDEINSLKPELQAKLLRVLQEKEFYRLGGTQSIHVNFRIIAAANKNLQQEVMLGHFRQDLLYRLRVISLEMPPLRVRTTDMEALVEHFLLKYARGNVKKTVSGDVMKAFKNYTWPGNIRELENIIQSLIIMTDSEEITKKDLPNWLLNNEAQVSTLDAASHVLNIPELKFGEIQQSLKDFITDMEKAYIRQTIRSFNGNVTEAARKLKVSRSKLYYTLKGDEMI